MHRLNRIVEVPALILHVLACVVTVLMMLHVVIDVLAKYLFAAPIDGTLEIVAAYYMVVVVFASLAYVTRHEGHILVELFTRKLPRRKLAAVDALAGMLTFALMVVLTWKTFEDAVRATELGEIWETGGNIIDIWPSRWLLPAGFGVMTAYVFLRLVEDIRVTLTGDRSKG